MLTRIVAPNLWLARLQHNFVRRNTLRELKLSGLIILGIKQERAFLRLLTSAGNRHESRLSSG